MREGVPDVASVASSLASTMRKHRSVTNSLPRSEDTLNLRRGNHFSHSQMCAPACSPTPARQPLTSDVWGRGIIGSHGNVLGTPSENSRECHTGIFSGASGMTSFRGHSREVIPGITLAMISLVAGGPGAVRNKRNLAEGTSRSQQRSYFCEARRTPTLCMVYVVASRNNALWVPRLPGLPAPPFAIFSSTLHVSHLSHVLTILQSLVINVLRQGKFKYLHDIV
jgi:hypothetical protein